MPHAETWFWKYVEFDKTSHHVQHNLLIGRCCELLLEPDCTSYIGLLLRRLSKRKEDEKKSGIENTTQAGRRQAYGRRTILINMMENWGGDPELSLVLKSPPVVTSVTAHRLSLGGRGDRDIGDTGRHDVDPYIGLFDVLATDHYLGNETLCLSEKSRRG
jgi:hypothetical protein